jgi:hypothetical protein
MQGRAQTCSVKDGRIRITCARCAKKHYVAVPAGTRKKTVRCVCGLSTLYTLNHRATPRESISGQAQLILLNGRECPVYLCDRSLGGISFNIPRQYARSVANGQDIRIKYRSMGGSTLQRKIRIKSMNNNRVGAQVLDGFLPSF